MGGKTSTAPINPFMPQSVQSTQIPPEVRAAYQKAIGRAEQVSQTPFQRYSESPEAFVAPMTGTQRMATQNILQQQYGAQPYYQAGAALTGRAGTTAAPDVVGQYISPYTQAVAAPTMALLGQQQGQQLAQQQAEAIRGGAYGGERAGLQRQLLRGQQQLASGKTMGDIMQAGYAPAMQAAQADLARQLQAGGQFGTLGAGAQQAGLQAAQALMGAGTVEQQTQQAGLQALYNQFLQERAYPFQTSQFYTGAVTGAGPLFGSTQYNYQQPQYQPFFSDPRLKQGLGAAYARGGEPERVGQLDSGEGVYSYRLTDPRTGQTGPAQIGLMSDEVRPDAVGRDPQTGYDVVDYDRATENARMGGAVIDMEPGKDYWRGGYADGGIPGGGLMPEELSALSQAQQNIGSSMRQGLAIGGHLSYVDPTDPAAMQRRIDQNLLAHHKEMYGGLGSAAPGLYGQEPSATAGSGIRGYVPSTAIQPGRMLRPSGAPEVQRASGMTIGDVLSKGADVAKRGFALREGLQSEKSPFKTGSDSSYLDKASFLSKYLFATGGVVPHYAEGGDAEYFPTDVLKAQKPAELEKPKSTDSQQSQDKQKGSGLLGSLAKLGASAAANYFLPGSGAVVSGGLGALGLATGGRAAFQDGGPEEESEADKTWRRMIHRESGGKQFDRSGQPLMSDKGATGIAQVMPGTAPEAAKLAGVEYDPVKYRRDADYNEALGKAYYNKQLSDFGRTDLAAAAYNAGPGAVRRALARSEATGRDYLNYLPQETQKYVAGVMGGGDFDLSKLPAGARSFRASSEGVGPAREILSRSSVAPKDRSFTEEISERPERLVIPALMGLGAMASSPSRFLGSAILQGVGAGAKGYLDMGTTLEEQEKLRAEQELLRSQGLLTREEAEKVPAETFRVLQEARDLGFKNFGSADNPNWFVQLSDGSMKPLYEWMESGEPLAGGSAAAELARQLHRGLSTTGSMVGPAAKQPPGPAGTPVGAGAPAAATPKGAESVPQLPPVTTTAKPPAPMPAAKPAAIPGVVFDEDSAKAAAAETRNLQRSADQPQVRQTSRDYIEGANREAQSANQQKIFYNEMADIVSKASSGKLLAAPGPGYEFTSGVIGALNRAVRAIPGLDAGENFFGNAREYNDVMTKLTTLQAQAAAKGADQKAVGALIANMEALPSLSKEPGAAAQVAASNMVTNQKSIDRKRHADEWGKLSRGIYSGAMTDFEGKNGAEKYAQEQNAIQRMLLDKGDKEKRIAPGSVVFEMMKQQKVKPEQIDEYFEARYGIPKEQHMSRYFLGAR